MTKDQAIMYLRSMQGICSPQDRMAKEAVKMATEALSADAEPSLKAIKRQIDEHWYLDPPSAEAEQGYTQWLEKIIVDAETFEWLCEDTNDKEWCEENCHYSSIQAECLRHLYEVNKGGDSE